ncbi:hypothetical protein M0802_010911 [Mischocyttarus mexicanus]|nr:hypothetical protein M0802_010911 [Mischocyttarus mexicanus]
MRGQSTSYTRCVYALLHPYAHVYVGTRTCVGHHRRDHEATHHLLNPKEEWEDVVEGGPDEKRFERSN